MVQVERIQLNVKSDRTTVFTKISQKEKEKRTKFCDSKEIRNIYIGFYREKKSKNRNRWGDSKEEVNEAAAGKSPDGGIVLR